MRAVGGKGGKMEELKGDIRSPFTVNYDVA
jgi:hypothetical protein